MFLTGQVLHFGRTFKLVKSILGKANILPALCKVLLYFLRRNQQACKCERCTKTTLDTTKIPQNYNKFVFT